MRTLSNAIERLVGRGFTAHFGVVGDRLRAFDSGKTFGAHELIIREFQRFEGVSEHEDMASCTRSRAGRDRGSLVDAIGPTRAPRGAFPCVTCRSLERNTTTIPETDALA